MGEQQSAVPSPTVRFYRLLLFTLRWLAYGILALGFLAAWTMPALRLYRVPLTGALLLFTLPWITTGGPLQYFFRSLLAPEEPRDLAAVSLMSILVGGAVTEILLTMAWGTEGAGLGAWILEAGSTWRWGMILAAPTMVASLGLAGPEGVGRLPALPEMVRRMAWMGLGGLVGVLSLRGLSFSRDWLGGLGWSWHPPLGLPELTSLDLGHLAVTTVLTLMMLLLTRRVEVHRVPAVVYVLGSLMLALFWGGAVSFWLDQVIVGGAILGMLTLVAFTGSFGVHYPLVPYDGPDDPADWALHARAVAARTRRLPDGPLFVIAAHGGGIQASAWTAGVLSRLGFDDGRLVMLTEGEADESHYLREEFWRRVVLMTGVSGGAVGLAHVLVDRNNAYRKATTGSLNALASCFTSLRDRGITLEEEWRRIAGFARQGGRREKLLMRGTMAEAVKDGLLPCFVFQSTVLETGLPFTMGPLPMPAPRDAAHEDSAAARVADLHAAHPDADIGLFTAARLSATFPFATAMARAARGWGFHLADGGYFDNRGVFTALRWLRGVSAVPDSPIVGRHVVLLELDGFPKSPPPTAHGDMRANLVGPADLLFTVWRRSQAVQNEEQMADFPGLGDGKLSRMYMRFQPRGWHPGIPLSWQLSVEERRSIDVALAEMAKEEFCCVEEP